MASKRKTKRTINNIKSLFEQGLIYDVTQTCQQCKHYGCAGKECNGCRVFYLKTNFQDIKGDDYDV